jgi:NADPH-dependent 2,4-dienoyl-CoA reductase/sulfur reductase-like enzyme
VRDIADSLSLRERLRPGARLLVVGAGFIGLEVAAVARAAGCEVTIVELAAHPLGRVAPREIGGFFAELHRGHGVDLRLGAALTAIEPAGERLLAFSGDGERIEADAVLIGIGAVPNGELAEAAGLAVDDGVVVDEFGRTDDPAIHAAGDVTRHFNPLLGRHIRLEAWQNAQNQAIAVAKAMAGGSEPHAEVPWFWTDQYDVNFQSAGVPLAWERLVWRGTLAERRCTVFFLQDGVVVGGATINNGRDMRFVRQLIAAGRPIDPDSLADPRVKLPELCRGL